MAQPLGSVKLEMGDTIKSLYTVKRKLGEGACGAVYLVQSTKDPNFKAALKVEPLMKCKEDEILKMEVFVLKRLQNSKHVCRLLLAGKSETFNFMVITLLGRELSELRRRAHDRKLSRATGLKVGIQVVQALCDMHTVGFIHRDVKPSNFACGYVHKNLILMFDFGLARQILIRDLSGKMVLRPPRNKVSFRGTVRYCSPNVHNNKEQGRHDDLISMMYMLVELITATLPWKGLARRDSGHKKQTCTDKELFHGCPSAFQELYGSLRRMTYFDEPKYDKIRKLFKNELVRMRVKLTDPFEWEKRDKERPKPEKESFAGADREKLSDRKEIDEIMEKDQSEDTDTGRDADESIESATSDDSTTGGGGYAREDTLDDVGDLEKKAPPKEERERKEVAEKKEKKDDTDAVKQLDKKETEKKEKQVPEKKEIKEVAKQLDNNGKKKNSSNNDKDADKASPEKPQSRKDNAAEKAIVKK